MSAVTNTSGPPQSVLDEFEASLDHYGKGLALGFEFNASLNRYGKAIERELKYNPDQPLAKDAPSSAVEDELSTALDKYGEELLTVLRANMDQSGTIDKAFNPDQPRNEHGEWSSGGGGDFVAREAGQKIGSEALASLTKPGHFYRGMTSTEFDATLGAGKGVGSRGSYSSSTEGTSFASDVPTAESYVNYGRDDPRTTGKPTYLVEVKGSENIKGKPDGYFHSKEVVPIDQVTNVWRMQDKNGAIVAEHISLKKFNPDQPRNEHGEWTSGGGDSGSKSEELGSISPASVSEIATQTAKDFGIDPSKVKVAAADEVAYETVGNDRYPIKAKAERGSDVITYYPSQISEKEMVGLAAHETMHVKYGKAFESGTLGDARNFAALKAEGGVSDYSKWVWRQVASGNATSNNAIDETLAEMALIKAETGKLPDGFPAYTKLYNRVMGK